MTSVNLLPPNNWVKQRRGAIFNTLQTDMFRKIIQLRLQLKTFTALLMHT